MKLSDIQFDLFPTAPALSQEPEKLALIRVQKWAHGGYGDVDLVSIELVPHDGRWMWAACLNSKNGSGQGSRALPKWGKFAATKVEALLNGLDEVRAFMHRATEAEQLRISGWLGTVADSAIATMRA